MTRRRQDRASAFAARAYWDGNLQEYTSATRVQWAHEDRAREQRARRVRVLLAVPLWAWLVLLGVGVLLAFAFLHWIGQHPFQATVLALVVIGAFAARYVMRQGQHEVVEAEEVAPPDVRRAQVQLDPLRTPMTAETRATHDALPAGSGRYYLQALEQGVVPAPTRSRGDGCDRISVPLPGGRVAPSDVRLDRFAQTLGIAAGRVRRGEDVPGTLVLDVLDVDPSAMTAGAWPSLGASTSWDAPTQIGVDEVGAPVTVNLAGARVLTCGQSGSGKTRFLRLLASAAASDPRVELHVIDAKGGGTWLPLRERAVYFHQGPTDESVKAHLSDVVDMLRARYRRMSAGEDVISSDGWVVVVIDECHALWDRTGIRGTDLLVEEIARQGREAGVGLILGTHGPNKESVPTMIGEQADVRVLLRTTASWAPGLVLGDYGVDAASMPRGHAWLNVGDGVRRIVTHHVDDDDVRLHMEGVPALPPAPDLPVIVASAGGDVDDDEGPDEDAPDLLRDVQSAIAGRAGIGWDELADALGMTRAEVQAALRPHGITSAAFYSQETRGTVRGVRADAVEAALGA